jgi:hypothetical protein
LGSRLLGRELNRRQQQRHDEDRVFVHVGGALAY